MHKVFDQLAFHNLRCQLAASKAGYTCSFMYCSLFCTITHAYTHTHTHTHTGTHTHWHTHVYDTVFIIRARPAGTCCLRGLKGLAHYSCYEFNHGMRLAEKKRLTRTSGKGDACWHGDLHVDMVTCMLTWDFLHVNMWFFSNMHVGKKSHVDMKKISCQHASHRVIMQVIWCQHAFFSEHACLEKIACWHWLAKISCQTMQ